MEVQDFQLQSKCWDKIQGIGVGLISGEFTRQSQASYDDRFDQGLIYSSLGKFGNVTVFCEVVPSSSVSFSNVKHKWLAFMKNNIEKLDFE